MQLVLKLAVVCLLVHVLNGASLRRAKRWDLFSRFGEFYNDVRDRVSDTVDHVSDVADTVGVQVSEHLDLARDHLEDVGVNSSQIEEVRDRVQGLTRVIGTNGREILKNGRRLVDGIVDDGMTYLGSVLQNGRNYLRQRKQEMQRFGNLINRMKTSRHSRRHQDITDSEHLGDENVRVEIE